MAAALRVPLVEAHLQPIGPPTAEFPGMLIPDPPRWTSGAGNLVGHLLTNTALSVPLRAAVRRAAETALGNAVRPAAPTSLALYGYSPRVVPKPRSWGPKRNVTGYWTLLEPEWQPSAELEAFLAAGPPPVCVGFGSMPLDDPVAWGRLVQDAAESAATRVLLLGGWGGLTAHGEDVLTVPSAPHTWVFPRVAAVVHHGGAGTTGAAVTAGIASVIVPWGADQPFWAARLRRLGVAGDPVPRKQLTAAVLGAALRQVLGDGALRDRAARLGEQVRTEDGTGAAAALIEQVAVTV